MNQQRKNHSPKSVFLQTRYVKNQPTTLTILIHKETLMKELKLLKLEYQKICIASLTNAHVFSSKYT